MTFSIFKKIGLGEPKQLLFYCNFLNNSWSTQGNHKGCFDKSGWVIFPIDFFVLDNEEDKETPVILGRPFLATSGVLIYVLEGKVTMRIEDEKVTFDVLISMEFLPKV